MSDPAYTLPAESIQPYPEVPEPKFIIAFRTRYGEWREWPRRCCWETDKIGQAMDSLMEYIPTGELYQGEIGAFPYRWRNELDDHNPRWLRVLYSRKNDLIGSACAGLVNAVNSDFTLNRIKE